MSTLSSTAVQASLESRLAALREEVFAVADEARRAAPFGHSVLHVSLQAASNELGKAEQALRGSASEL